LKGQFAGYSRELPPPFGRFVPLDELPEAAGASKPPLNAKFCKAVAFIHSVSRAVT